MSTVKMKAGKISVEHKPRTTRITAEEAFGGGNMNLPDDVAAEFEKKGWEPRWLNAAEVYKNQGYHKRGWQVYKRPANAVTGKPDFTFGQDPDGVIRRGDCILGYKEPEAAAKHKAYLRQTRNAQMGYKDTQLKDMRETAKSAGVKMAIEEDDGDE